MLTIKQQQFFNKLKETYSSLALPSYSAIATTFNFKSKNSVKQYIQILKQKNYLETIENNLYIKKDKLGANFVMSSVKAGFASIMDDKIEKRLSIDELLNINAPSSFVFKVSGDSMIDIGIYEDDYVVIKKTSKANVGDIVLGIIDNEFSLKVLRHDKNGAYLEPQNKDYPNLRPKFSLKIFGVATGIVRQFKLHSK